MSAFLSYELISNFITEPKSIIDVVYLSSNTTYLKKGAICTLSFNNEIQTITIATPSHVNQIIGVLLEDGIFRGYAQIVYHGNAYVKLIPNTNPQIGDKIKLTNNEIYLNYGYGEKTTSNDETVGVIGIVTKVISSNEAIVYLTIKNDMLNATII